MTGPAAFVAFILSVSLAWAATPARAAPLLDPIDPSAQRQAASRCMLVARNLQRQALPVRMVRATGSKPQIAENPWLQRSAYEPPEVRIRYAGHATFIIETPQGVRIATDFSGAYGSDPLPDVVTMNHAHITHWTPIPDPEIQHVLKGWADADGTPAQHWLAVGDALIRNVPTDIRDGIAMERAGNSIFIFEVADLCIGHLGHLHHPLTDAHHAAIGRLDIVMVPIDGGLTLSTDAMAALVGRLQARIVLPMHRRYSPIENFLSRVRGEFDVRFEPTDTIDVSIRTLPRTPTIVILEGV
ncbi:MBL fold metallo-hydrolase [Notoacmeibacter ruber]|uniref:Zn-dependent hydrolase n=1 Tax=Notoacmeibacter ruber TaxID=2670375 RepID=A0A3L7JE18_9HYPH|nr:MBL fold metallo-hydrolase [Notoacmeibacter ruber]RLQ88704.1 Zn-dependent hydrolase [Notoacmeibacter ruber]